MNARSGPELKESAAEEDSDDEVDPVAGLRFVPSDK